MPNNKTNTDPDLYARLEEKRNFGSESLSFKSFFSADFSLKDDVFSVSEQAQDIKNQTFLTPSPRLFYISSSDITENISNVTHRRYTL